MEQVITLQKKAQTKKFIVSYLPLALKTLIKGDTKIEHNNVNLKVANLVDMTHIFIRKHLFTYNIFFNMDSRILKKKYGKNYNYYIDYLIEHQFIKVFSDYCVGKKARTFKIYPKLLDNIELYNNSDNVLLKKYKEIYSLKYLQQLNYQYISENVMVEVVKNINRVTIKFKEAEKYINSLEMVAIKDIKNKHSIKTIYLDDLWYKFDDYGRFHSNLTTLKAEIRKKYILIDDEPTMELDIANSQPIFLTHMMKDHLDTIDNEEYEFFKILVLKGRLYKYIASQSDITNNGQIKKMVFRVFFGRNNPKSKGNIIFKKMFPSIFKFIICYKKAHGTHRAMSYELQRSESNMLFNNILSDVINLSEDIPFFTVHDSITVKQSQYNIVKKIFDHHIGELHLSIIDT